MPKPDNLVYAKKKDQTQQDVDYNTNDDFTTMTNQEIITDASGKLKKLGSRASGIYVDYLGGWSRADNYRHKHDKMQNVLMQYLKKGHWGFLRLFSTTSFKKNGTGHSSD